MTKVFVDTDEDFRHNASMASKLPRPTDGELNILRVLWDLGAGSVRDVQKALDAIKPTGYTTVLKLMQIMTEKGLVSRDESVRPQIYKARQTQEQTQQRLVSDLLQKAFGGSVRSMVLQALASKKSSPAELQEIEELLDRLEGGSK
jgi:BlaI family transcriptional regulator, penicillinase repressor